MKIAGVAGCSVFTARKYAKMVLNKPLKPGVNGNKFNQKDAARIVKAIRAGS
jgi:uncharacterized OsmC-like protein